MLKWNKLLNPTRRRELHGRRETAGTGAGRKEIERDYDRILFATPTRRMSDKTQVFPMEENVAIRTRLTHSHEVSNLARSIGVKVAFDHADKVFGADHDSLDVKRNIPAQLAAVGLAHDLGNPPFGHQGEKAISQWFQEKEFKDRPHNDFKKFDGNAQTFRLLTKLQVLNDEFGLNLTVSTLAALLKYPSMHKSKNKGGFKKFGVFESEEDVVKEVWDQTGLSEGVRHPLAYIMEACDDIAYSVIDAEDTVKKGYASFYDLIDFLESNAACDGVVKEVVLRAKDKNDEFRRESLTSKELNDISMQMFRVIAISRMVESATEVFVNTVGSMMDKSIAKGFEIINASDCNILCSTLKKFDYQHGFTHRDVLKLELEGNNYIKNVMDMLWEAISSDGNASTPFQAFAFSEISENYRRVYQSTRKDAYSKYQLLCDAVSGMTEEYLIKVNNELRALKDGRI